MTTNTALSRRKIGLGYYSVACAAMLLFFALLLDQGQIFSLVQGDIAYSQQIIHELVHDARHTAAAPCH